MIIKLNRAIEIREFQDEDSALQVLASNNEYRRQQLIEAAISLVHEVMIQGSDGTPEEADYLMSAVALKLHESSHSRLTSTLVGMELLVRARSRT